MWLWTESTRPVLAAAASSHVRTAGSPVPLDMSTAQLVAAAHGAALTPPAQRAPAMLGVYPGPRIRAIHTWLDDP